MIIWKVNILNGKQRVERHQLQTQKLLNQKIKTPYMNIVRMTMTEVKVVRWIQQKDDTLLKIEMMNLNLTLPHIYKTQRNNKINNLKCKINNHYFLHNRDQMYRFKKWIEWVRLVDSTNLLITDSNLRSLIQEFRFKTLMIAIIWMLALFHIKMNKALEETQVQQEWIN